MPPMIWAAQACAKAVPRSKTIDAVGAVLGFRTGVGQPA